MKKILYIGAVMLSALSITSCGTDEDTVAAVEGTAGMIVNVSRQSSGALLGSPDSSLPIAEAPITFSEAYLNLVVTAESGNFEVGDVESVQIYKYLNDGEGVLVGESTSLPYSLSYDNIDGFVAGTGVNVDELRIGDSFSFRVKVLKKDGTIYTYNTGMGRFLLSINCSYDLTGDYLMTNSFCNPDPIPVTITQNSDGTWYVSQADGGFLKYCTSNTTFDNPGSFAVGCGGVVDASGTEGGSQYCGSNGIGCIDGGSWDQDTGILILNNVDTWGPYGPYTSTYTRQ